MSEVPSKLCGEKVASEDEEGEEQISSGELESEESDQCSEESPEDKPSAAKCTESSETTAEGAVGATCLSEGSPSTNASQWKGFCNAFGSIMGRSINTSDAPMLCETSVVKKICEQKAEKKEQVLKSAQRRMAKDKGHVKVDVLQKNMEMRLRKVATQGVVRLFNAVKDFKAKEMDDTAGKSFSKVPIQDRKRKMFESNQSKFAQILNKEGRLSSKRRKTAVAANQPEAGDGHDALDEFA